MDVNGRKIGIIVPKDSEANILNIIGPTSVGLSTKHDCMQKGEMVEEAQYREVKPGYRVGDDGSFWSSIEGGCKPHPTDNWRKLNPYPLKSGHILASLGKRHRQYVHILVLEAFVGPCPPGMECLHWDGDPGNNKLTNLRWGTPKENQADSVRHGTAALVSGLAPKGEEHWTSKLSEDQARTIGHLRWLMELTTAEIMKFMKINPKLRGAVDGVARGQAWNHITGFPKYVPKSTSSACPTLQESLP